MKQRGLLPTCSDWKPLRLDAERALSAQRTCKELAERMHVEELSHEIEALYRNNNLSLFTVLERSNTSSLVTCMFAAQLAATRQYMISPRSDYRRHHLPMMVMILDRLHSRRQASRNTCSFLTST